MVLKDLLKDMDIISLTGDAKADISGVTFNSREAGPGNLFVAIDGINVDGHCFIDDAVNRGATAVLVEKRVEVKGASVIQVPDTKAALATAAANFYGRPAGRLRLIGVTGTNGKTTVTNLIKSILEYNGYRVGLIGTNQNMIGGTVIPTDKTTPDALELNRLFAAMEREKADFVVMEVSSHALEQGRVYGLQFEVGIFTNITQEHLDFHKTMQRYMAAKRKLFDMSGRCVINADDEHGRALAHELAERTLTYSIDSPAGVRAHDIKMSSLGVLFDYTYEGKDSSVRVNIPGRFSVYNALAAICACLELGLTREQIGSGLLVAEGVRGRAEVVYTPHTDYTVLIDYAHTPDGLKNIISTVREFTSGRVITLFGCGGDRDRTKRPVMGKLAGELSDYCVVTSDNPRTEQPMSIIREIEEGIRGTGCPYTVIENRREAIRYAMSIAQKDDCIILAGKGHETYQILGTTKVHFDEREVVRQILESK